MTGMSSMPARIEETSSSHCPQEPDVAPKQFTPKQFAPHQFFEKPDSSENHSSKFIENKHAQRTQSQPLLVPDKTVKSNSCQNNLQPAPPPPEGSAVFSTPIVCHPDAVRDGGDIGGSLNKVRARPVFSVPSSSLGVSKSVPCNSDLDLQLPEHIQGLVGLILLALNTLKLEKIAPTEENITYCLRYGNSKDRHTDVTAALNSALEQQIILKIKVGNLVLYVGRTERIWNCVNPLGGNLNQYRDATWNAIEKSLFSCWTFSNSSI